MSSNSEMSALATPFIATQRELEKNIAPTFQKSTMSLADDLTHVTEIEVRRHECQIDVCVGLVQRLS